MFLSILAYPLKEGYFYLSPKQAKYENLSSPSVDWGQEILFSYIAFQSMRHLTSCTHASYILSGSKRYVDSRISYFLTFLKLIMVSSPLLSQHYLLSHLQKSSPNNEVFMRKNFLKVLVDLIV